MELNVRLTTRPWPENGTRVLVLVIIIIAVLTTIRAGYGPGTVLPAVLGAGLTAIQVVRTLLENGATPQLPGRPAIPTAGLG